MANTPSKPSEEVVKLKEKVKELEEKLYEKESDSAINSYPPVIINMGKVKKKKIKRLKKGKGPLFDEVLDTIEEVAGDLNGEADEKVIVPIVILYRRKRGRRRNFFL